MLKKTVSTKTIQVLKKEQIKHTHGVCCSVHLVSDMDGNMSAEVMTNGEGIPSGDVATILRRLASKAAKKQFPFDKGFK